MGLTDRTRKILLNPKSEWSIIASEETDAKSVFIAYAIPLILANALACFLGREFIWGAGLHGVDALRMAVFSGLQIVLIQSACVIAGIFLVHYFAPNFGSLSNIGRAAQLIVFSMAPIWVGGLLMLIPPLAWIGKLFGIYSLYLLYLGFPKTMKTPEGNIISYMIIVLIGILIISGLALWIAGILFGDMLGLSVTYNSKIIGI